MAWAAAVKIAVVGDGQVGKTSLITAAATETFPDSPPPLLPPTKLPSDSTPEGVPIVITDTSSKPEDRQALEVAVQQADVIVLAFDKGRSATLDRVTSYWMPELQRLGVQVPVILVACKSDLRVGDHHLQQVVVPVMSRFKTIETCLECSAKKLTYVGEVFFYALKAVLHPTGPLFDPQANDGQGALRPLAVRALKRIFKMCDHDKDGALNDAELNNFQVKCFSAPLQPEELIGVKKVVSEKMPQGVNNKGLTLAGFLFLQALFIERARLETTWAVLRKFGYNNQLHLSDEVLAAVNFAHAPDQVVELTEVGTRFLEGQFREFNTDKDGLLTHSQQMDMFSTCPSSPWEGEEYERVMVDASPSGTALTLPGFLAKWAYTTAVNPRHTLAYLLYLGYEGDPNQLFNISRPRRQERKGDLPARSIYRCAVFGAEGSGKSSLIRSFVGAEMQTAPTKPRLPRMPDTGHVTAVGTVSPSEGPSCTLVLEEFSERAAESLLASPSCSERLAHYDCAAFVFDTSQLPSFRMANNLLLRVTSRAGDSLPCLFVATKDDLPMPRELVQECGEVCGGLALPLPVPVSTTRSMDKPHVYGELLRASQHPERAIPLTPSLRAQRQYRSMLKRAALYTALGVTGAIITFGLYRLHKKQQRSSPEATSAGPRTT